MNFLLWIALIGVIVFLLGVIYARMGPAAGKKPAAQSIAPATESSPAPKSAPTPAVVTIKAEKPTDAVSLTITENAAEPVTVKAKELSADVPQSVITKPALPTKAVPPAEPVGPNFTKNSHSADTAPQEMTQALSHSEPAIINEPEPIEPSRLTAPRNGQADDLTKIEGIGTAVEARLFRLGIFHYDQLSDLSILQTDWLNAAIGFSGRVERESWSVQAKKLAAKQAVTKKAVAKQTDSAKSAGKSDKTTKIVAKAKTATKAKTRKTTVKAD